MLSDSRVSDEVVFYDKNRFTHKRPKRSRCIQGVNNAIAKRRNANKRARKARHVQRQRTK